MGQGPNGAGAWPNGQTTSRHHARAPSVPPRSRSPGEWPSLPPHVALLADAGVAARLAPRGPRPARHLTQPCRRRDLGPARRPHHTWGTTGVGAAASVSTANRRHLDRLPTYHRARAAQLRVVSSAHAWLGDEGAGGRVICRHRGLGREPEPEPAKPRGSPRRPPCNHNPEHRIAFAVDLMVIDLVVAVELVLGGDHRATHATRARRQRCAGAGAA